MRPKKFSQTGTFVLRNVGAKGLKHTIIDVPQINSMRLTVADMATSVNRMLFKFV